MKVNFNTLENTIDNIIATKNILRVYDHVFDTLGRDTYTDGVFSKDLIKKSLIKMKAFYP